ncbi:MAG: T9SS type A sorting domain-containing protein [Saprospiraceae bacterium]|nr:T9SS type A sorting domain-containing protein [Saprospiraceae bacterium]
MRYRYLIFILVFIFSFTSSIAQEEGSHYCSRSKIGQDADFLNSRGSIAQEDFDVMFYSIDLQVFPSSKTISGSVLIRSIIINTTASLEIDLNSSLFVSSISTGGKNLSFEHKNNLLNIKLDKNYFPGDKIEITVNYSGTPGAAFHFDTKDGLPMIWTLSQPYGSMDWWPCKNFPDDKADSVIMKVTVPSDLKVVSNGKLLNETVSGNSTTYVWKENYPIVSYLVSLAIHPYIISTDYFRYTLNDSMPVVNYIVPSSFDVNKPKYEVTIDMLEAFSEMFGLYPFINEKYGHAEFPWNGGMEHQTISSMLGPYEFLIAHELAHQWWGDMITCDDFHHIWLNEGFATYSEALWQEYKSGREALHSTMNNKRYLGRGKIYVDNIDDQGRIFNQGLSYNKAAWVLHMLRNVVGHDMFFQILKAYGNSDKRFSTAVTEDFKQICEQISQTDLDYFFDQWIYGDFHPVYLYDWNFTENNGSFKTKLTISQFQTGRVYSMPVDVSIMTESGEEKFRIFNDRQMQIFEFLTDSKPLALTFDKENWILKEIREGIGIANHDNNSMLFSVTGDGSLGFENPDGFGNGLIYPESGENTLFYGSFMLANSQDYIADNSENQHRKDFKNLGIFFKADAFQGSQEIKTSYSDALHPTPKGIVIEQKTYSDPVFPNREFVIMDYKIRNKGNESLNTLWPALFMDLDIGDYLGNYIKKDEQNKMIYQYNNGIYIGIKLLSLGEEKINYTGITDAVDAFSENKKFDYIAGILNQFQSEKKADWSSLLSNGPYKLPAGDSMNISFAVIGGTSEQNLKSNAEYAQNFYNTHLVNTKETEPEGTDYTVYPNPASDHINISLENNSECQIELTDVIGKTIKHLNCIAQTKEIIINTADLKPGIYFIMIKNEEKTSVYKVVLE